MAANGGGGGVPDVEDPFLPAAPAGLFPLGKEILVEVSQAVTAGAVAATCTSLVVAQQGLDPTINAHMLAVMRALLYAYLPIGLFALLFAASVKKKPDLVGVSSGFLLGHLLLPTVIGGVVNIVKSGEEGWIVGLVAILFLVGTVLIWRKICDYPQFLHGRRGGN